MVKVVSHENVLAPISSPSKIPAKATNNGNATTIRVTYPGWDKKWDRDFQSDSQDIKDLSFPLTVGQKVQCRYQGTWYDA
jgi:hypothetical protein